VNFGGSAGYVLKQKGGLFDFIYGVSDFGPVTADEEVPVFFPLLAYSYIWNEYYRDENLQNEVSIHSASNKGLLCRNWEKDYFTSALPWRQRGTSPAMPIIVNGSNAVFDGGYDGNFPWASDNTVMLTNDDGSTIGLGFTGATPVGSNPFTTFKTWLNDNHINVNAVGAWDINDFRLGFQVQKWLERNARAGVRYTEMLRAHFGCAPRDDRLDRPEYIGGSKQPVIFSEVLKTSDSSTGVPQGYQAGHGISADRTHVTKYHVQEYGIIMSLLSVMPRSGYSQGLERMWLRDTKYDYYWPEFAHLGEQPIFGEEILLSATNTSGPGGTSTNREIFGYQGRYDEYRQRRSTVHGNLKPGGTLDYWTLCREFDLNVALRPKLNADFVMCKDTSLKRIYPVQTMPGMLINYGNIITAIRPMPVTAEPGLIDHF
jgi:hypothetical protein